MEPRNVFRFVEWLNRFPLLHAIHNESTWREFAGHPERGVLTKWLAWDIACYNEAVATLEHSLAALQEYCPRLCTHYQRELASRREWIGFWGLRSEIYLATWLVGRGFTVRLPEKAPGRKPDFVVAAPEGGDVTVETSGCFSKGEDKRRKPLWELEVRISHLGMPLCVDLSEAWPKSEADSKEIARKLEAEAEALGHDVLQNTLKVHRDAHRWLVTRQPRPDGPPYISLPFFVSRLSRDRLIAKLKEERSQLPKTGTNVITLDMSHVDDWYSEQLSHIGAGPLTCHWDKLTPAVQKFFDHTDNGERVAAVLLFTRDLDATHLCNRHAFPRHDAHCGETLRRLLQEWRAQ